MEKENEQQILAQLKNQADLFSDNWKDSTGRRVSRQMYQAIQEGVKISVQKESIIAMCRTIRARCQEITDGDSGASQNDCVKKLEKHL